MGWTCGGGRVKRPHLTVLGRCASPLIPPRYFRTNFARAADRLFREKGELLRRLSNV